MSHELISQLQASYEFPEQYPPAPADQVEAETVLRQSIEAQFPDSVSVLDRTVHTLDWYVGHKESFGSGGLDTGAGIADEVGLEDEMPIETVAVVGGIYGLTGASIVRVDRKNNGNLTEVIRKGTYKGEDVYFGEYYTSTDDKPKFSWALHGKKVAQDILNRPDEGQRAEFEQIAGQPFPPEQLPPVNITKDNYVERANEIAGKKAAEQANHDQAAADQQHHERRLSMQSAKKVAQVLAEEENLLGHDDDSGKGLSRELMAENIALRNQQYAADQAIIRNDNRMETTKYKPGRSATIQFTYDAEGVIRRAAKVHHQRKLNRVNKRAKAHYEANETQYMEQAVKDAPVEIKGWDSPK